MASPGGGKAADGHEKGSLHEGGEHSNPEVMLENYEELFEQDGSERPCYLPDAVQEDDGPPHVEDGKDGKQLETVEKSAAPGENAEGQGKVKPEKGLSGRGMEAPRSETSGGSEDGGEPPQKDNGDKSGADSSGERSVVSDRELSSDQGQDDKQTSPSSSQGGTSGYMAGSGSSGSSASGAGPSNRGSAANGSRKHARPWEPGKRHPDEDDTHLSWRQHKKHFFILSNAGKPVYSRYGDENKLAGFSATLQAIMSFVQNSGDTIQLVQAGDHQIIFLIRGPLYLVCISSTDEPYAALKGQLELLHGQVLLILTTAVEKCFAKNSKFDMRPLLGGTEVVFSSLIHSFNWNPACFMHAYTCLSLPYNVRQAAVVALQDMTETGALFAMLMCGAKVIGLVGARKTSLHPDDILLLSNFISSSDSFRTSESFSPVCLPRYNTSVFMYAYVQYLDKDVCLVLLTADSGNFFHLKECRAQIETVLRESDVLHEVNNSLVRGGLRIEDVPETGPSSDEGRPSGGRGPADQSEDIPGLGGPAGLWHFMYRSTYIDQYVASEFSPPLNTRVSQKRLYRAYQKVHVSMNEGGGAGPHKMQYRRDENFVLLCWRTTDFVLYAAFDPLAEKSGAIAVCNRICQWLREMESEIFLLGATPFSWLKQSSNGCLLHPQSSPTLTGDLSSVWRGGRLCKPKQRFAKSSKGLIACYRNIKGWTGAHTVSSLFVWRRSIKAQGGEFCHPGTLSHLSSIL